MSEKYLRWRINTDLNKPAYMGSEGYALLSALLEREGQRKLEEMERDYSELILKKGDFVFMDTATDKVTVTPTPSQVRVCKIVKRSADLVRAYQEYMNDNGTAPVAIPWRVHNAIKQLVEACGLEERPADADVTFVEDHVRWTAPLIGDAGVEKIVAAIGSLKTALVVELRDIKDQIG